MTTDTTADVIKIPIPEAAVTGLTLDEVLRIRRGKGGRAQDRIGKRRSYIAHETAFGAAAARRRRQARVLACNRLEQLPVFTGPDDAIDAIHIHQTPEGLVTLVGSWPQMAAFSLELLKTSPLVRIDNGQIAIVLSNAAATYEAFAVGRWNAVVARLVASHVEASEPQAPADSAEAVA